MKQKMHTIYFVSDAHFGVDIKAEEQRRRRFYDFLEHVRATGQALYIVGDLFDFWFEYRTVIPKHAYPILRRLSDLVASEVELHYFAGNHDLWLGDFIRDQVGAQVHRDALAVELQGLKLYVVHGDGLAKSDRGYRLIKRVFRNRLNIFLFGWLHPDVGIPLARALSVKSRQKGENRRELEYIDFARTKFDEGYDAVIMGHTHLPRLEEIGGHFYVNLGDWMEHFTYGVLEEGSLRLQSWPDSPAHQDEAASAEDLSLADGAAEGNRSWRDR